MAQPNCYNIITLSRRNTMKRRFNKLLAAILTASLCVPALPTGPVQAARTDAFWTEKETVPVNLVSSVERSVNFNGGWKFNLGDSATAFQTDFNDSEWTNLSLPHDYSIFQPFTPDGEAESGFLPGGTGWYRKSFSLPQELSGKSILLNFDGVYKDATVYVNGEKIGEHHYGYTPFAFDISDKLIFDGKTDNLVAVKVEHQTPSSRWYSGSGIYRDVTLVVTDPVHVAKDGTFVTTPNLATSNGKDGTVRIAVDVQNDGAAAASVTVRSTIYEKGSQTALATVETPAQIPAGATTAVEAQTSVSSPKLWSVEEPNLYIVKTEIVSGSATLDAYETEFGFKWFAFLDNEGFQLNGSNLKINGVCMHHDQGGLGAAAYHDAIYRQMSIMKDMGVNTIRITHNPGAEVLVDICNEIGLLVIEEAFDGWGIPKNGNSYDFSQYFDAPIADDNPLIGKGESMTWAEFTMKSMIKRDRNDASIILWSLGNEISEGTGGNYTWAETADKMLQWIKDVDTAHPPTSGSNRRSLTDAVAPVNQKIFEDGGVPGYNYGDLGSMTSLHERYPVMLWSETVSPNNSRGIYTTQGSQTNADGKYHLTSYDTSRVGWGKTVHDSMYPTLKNDWIAGECVWTGFDYIGEPTPWNGTGRGDGGRGAIPNSSYFGIAETTGFPKDNFYLYRSQWNQNSNTLHLVTAWDENNMMTDRNGKTPVWVYSNAAKVELYRNDVKIGTATRKNLSETTTEAGHVHYEYTTQSHDEAICSTTSGVNSESLYSVFDVAFESGTISAKAFDENGNEITDQCEGNRSVSTPGAAARLSAYANKEAIEASGSSLSYITVDVTDENGSLLTTADNEIHFTLTGNGEILGVDNGDQATVHKYQQPSVLMSKTSAKIQAFSGKALVIVRSTEEAGGFTLKAESEGLTSSVVTVATNPVSSGAPKISYYTLSKHCYIPAGASDLTLPASITAGFTDGSTQDIPVTWSAFDKANLSKKGSFSVNGAFHYGGQPVNVQATVHVYDPIGGVQGFSLYTEPEKMPSLPASAMAYSTAGEAFEEYPVTWDTSAVSADSFKESGTVVSIPGTVDVLGKNWRTRATVRVAEPEATEQTNVATAIDHLVDNGPYNDTLNAIKDGKRTDGSHASSDRWSTWDLKDVDTDQPHDNISITMDWATATITDQINLFFYKETAEDGSKFYEQSVLPTSVTFEYALSSNYEKGDITANEWIEIGYSEPTDVEGFTNANRTIGKTYKLNESINPQAIRVTFSHPAKTFMGLNEIEVIGTAYAYHPKTSAEVTGVNVNGQTIALDKNDCVIQAGFAEELDFVNPNNAALTFIRQDNNKVKIIAVSEDGSATKTYYITLTDMPTQSTTTELQNKLDEWKVIDSSSYTPESYKAFMQLLQQVEAEMDTLTESELKEKINELNTAYAKLDAITPMPPAPDNPPVNTVPALKTGDKTTSGNVEYAVLDAEKKTAAAVALTNAKASKITIPDSVSFGETSCTIVSISANAFSGAKKLKSVTIGKNVTEIGKNAFGNCKKLNKVTFANGSVKIAKKAFAKTSSKMTVKIPKDLKKNKKKSAAFKKLLTKAGMSKKLKLK